MINYGKLHLFFRWLFMLRNITFVEGVPRFGATKVFEEYYLHT